MKHLTMLFLATAIGVLGLAATAVAGQCGEAGGKGNPSTGTLLLRSADSTTELSFKRDKAERRLVLEFDVDGCELAANALIKAMPRSSDLDDEAVFGEPDIEPEENSLYVSVPVDPGQFDAGQHSASVTVRGPGLVNTTRAKVSLQRTEDAWKPTLLTILAIIAGIGCALAVSGLPAPPPGKGGSSRLLRLGSVIVLAVLASGAVWWTSYGDAEVWEWELDTWGPLFFGAVTAAYGAATGALQAKKPSGG
jgi:hypothetical protein